MTESSEAAVLRKGPANLKEGWVMVGGMLELTPDQLIFSSHGFAQKKAVRSWSLKELTSVEPARTLGLIPNALRVRVGATELRFVVTGRAEWVNEIRAAAARLRPAG